MTFQRRGPNNRSNNRPGKKEDLFEVHPISEKMILRGHPWITRDKFSAKFPDNEKHYFIKVKKRNGQLLAVCLNDPKHKFVKARVWTKELKPNYGLRDFKEDVKKRIENAVKRRVDFFKERDNVYLVFAEADFLPGLKILKLEDYYLISTYSYIWQEFMPYIVECLEMAMEDVDVDFDRNTVWVQSRSEGYLGQRPPEHFYKLNDFCNMEIKEFGLKYFISIGKQYDHGLYSDMASVRKKTTPYFEAAKSMLNLFCYTGAFSVYAMAKGATKVVSVDLSQDYLDRVVKNIGLNSNLDASTHQSVCSDAEIYVKEAAKKDEKFDLIVCDPPSSFSDGSSRTSILDFYQENLGDLTKLISENGNLIIFCNTQKFSRKKFEFFILDEIKNKNLNVHIKSKLHTAEDCPRLRGFPEGDYLKGIILAGGAGTVTAQNEVDSAQTDDDDDNGNDSIADENPEDN